MDQFVAVSDRDLEAAKHATGTRDARATVRAALRFAAKYGGRPAYAMGLDLDTPHPDTLTAIMDFKTGRFTRHRTAAESISALRAQIAAKAKKKAA